MNKSEVARALKEMANLLEILEASRFEFSAFRNAASAVEDLSDDLDQTVNNGNITDIPGIGKGTGQFITEMVLNGSAADLDNIRQQVPAGIPTLLRFRGLGPKKVKLLWQQLGITAIDDLEKAIDEGEVAKLKGFGPTSIESLKSSVDYFRAESPDKSQHKSLTGQASAASTGETATESQPTKEVIKSTGKILAGTSGYSYPKWKGSFYPDNAKTAELLKHYATDLHTVEINNTFYRFPSEKVVAQWKAQTSAGFQFSLKAHRRITHQMRLNENSMIRVQEFVERCSILGNRLGCILFQLPPDFAQDDSRLQNLLSSLPQGPRFAVEFRHASWHTDEIYDQLALHNIACVCGDSETNKPKEIATADFIYARLRKTGYTKSELKKWNLFFAKQQKQEKDVLVYLKHDDTGDAPNTIKELWRAST